jgi:phosphoribosylformylglycinamidine (FGAM) synthase PurS component
MKNIKLTNLLTFLLTFTALASSINIISFYKNTIIAEYNESITKNYKKTFDEYSELLEIEEKNLNNSKIQSDIEKKEIELSALETKIADFITFLKKLSKDKTQPKNKLRACLELATINIDGKNYNKANEYLNKILEQYLYNTYIEKNINLTLIAEAHVKKAALYEKLEKNLSKKKDHKNEKFWYLKKIAMHQERAKTLFKQMTEKKSLDINGNLKIDQKNIHIYESNMLECSLESAIYTLKFLKYNQNIEQTKIEKYKKYIETSLNEIINFVDKKNEKNITAEMIYCKILSLIKLAIFLSRYESEDVKNLNQFKLKILNLFKEAENLTNKNMKILKTAYYKLSIDDILHTTKNNISELETDI